MALTASRLFDAPPDAISAAAEADFFTALKGRNNTFKKTGAGRFAAIDAAVIAAIGNDPLDSVLDIGISSGATTIELRDSLQRAGHRPSVTGTDLWIDAWLVPVAPGCRALVDGSGHLLQHDLFGRAVRPWRRRLDYVNGLAVVRATLNRLVIPRVRAALAAGRGRRLRLVSPQLARHADVVVQQDDVTVANPGFAGRFDLVRAANILNRDYFDEATLLRALANVIGYLSGPGAWLLVIRTLANGEQHGTLFRRNADGMAVVRRFGTGSEVEALVLAAAVPAKP
ncbi:hypothetical protein [Sandarakinorhabdus sp. DWP1-3-1]|uniref:hypothetical protein n=1 Tax=Sandarakinorhabdus sp. DWP1-3-1 TaxID=2804627 RepID=UPI003CEE6367